MRIAARRRRRRSSSPGCARRASSRTTSRSIRSSSSTTSRPSSSPARVETVPLQPGRGCAPSSSASTTRASPAFTVATKLNLPTSYLLIHRTWLGGIGLLSQLEAEAPFKAILEENLPGLRPDSGVGLSRDRRKTITRARPAALDGEVGDIDHQGDVPHHGRAVQVRRRARPMSSGRGDAVGPATCTRATGTLEGSNPCTMRLASRPHGGEARPRSPQHRTPATRRGVHRDVSVLRSRRPPRLAATAAIAAVSTAVQGEGEGEALGDAGRAQVRHARMSTIDHREPLREVTEIEADLERPVTTTSARDHVWSSSRSSAARGPAGRRRRAPRPGAVDGDADAPEHELPRLVDPDRTPRTAPRR